MFYNRFLLITSAYINLFAWLYRKNWYSDWRESGFWKAPGNYFIWLKIAILCLYKLMLT